MKTLKRYPYTLFGDIFDLGFISDKTDKIVLVKEVPIRDAASVICKKTREARERGERLVPVLIYESKAFTFSAVAHADGIVVLERLVAEVA